MVIDRNGFALACAEVNRLRAGQRYRPGAVHRGGDGGGGRRIVQGGGFIARRANRYARHIPIHVLHRVAIRVAEGDGFIGDGGIFQRQLGALGEVAEGENDFLIFFAQQVAFALVLARLVDVHAKARRVGQVGKHHHGGAAVCRHGDGLGSVPRIVRGGIRRVEIAVGRFVFHHGVGAGLHAIHIRDGVGDAVLHVVVAGERIAAREGFLVTGLRLAQRGRVVDLRVRVVGRGEQAAHRQLAVVHIVVFEDGDLAIRRVVGVDVHVHVRGYFIVAIRVRGDGRRAIVHFQGIFHIAIGDGSFLDGVILAILELRQVDELHLAVLRGLRREGLLDAAAFRHVVEGELRAIERPAALGHGVGFVVLGDGDDHAPLVHDGAIAGEAGVVVAGREGNLRVRFRRGVRLGRDNLLDGVGTAHIRARADHGIGQLDIRDGHAAICTRGILLRLVLRAPLAIAIVVQRRISAAIVEHELRARQRSTRFALHAHLIEGEIRQVAHVGEGHHDGVLCGVGGSDCDLHSAARFGQPGLGHIAAPLDFGGVIHRVMGVPSARRGFFYIIGAGIERHGSSRAFAGDAEGGNRFSGAVGVCVDAEVHLAARGTKAIREAALVGLLHVEIALAVVHNSGGSAIDGRAEVARGHLDDHGVCQHVVGVGATFNFGELIPAGHEAGEADLAVFIRRQGSRNVHAGLRLHIAGDGRGCRERCRGDVGSGKGLEAQRELYARHGNASVIRLGEGEGAGAGVDETELLHRIGGSKCEGLVVVDEGEVALFRRGERATAHMGFHHGVGARGEIEFRRASGRRGHGSACLRESARGGILLPHLHRGSILLQFKRGGHKGIAILLGQRNLTVLHVFHGDDGFDLRRAFAAIARRAEVVLFRSHGLIAVGHLGFRPIVGRERVEREVHQAVRPGGAGGDFLLLGALGTRVDGDLRARQRPGGAGSISAVTDLLNGHGHLLLEPVDDGVFAVFGVGIVQRGEGSIRVVAAVGCDMQRIRIAHGRSVRRPLGFDEDKVGLVFSLLYAVDLLTRMILNVVRMFLFQLVHLDGFGHAATGQVARAFRQVYARGELGHAFHALGIRGIREPQLKGGVGQVFLRAIRRLRHLIHHHLQIADGARAMLGMVFHAALGRGFAAVRDFIPLRRIGHEGYAEARGPSGLHKACRGLKLVEPIDIAALQRTGDHHALASVVGNAGFVDIVADAIGCHTILAVHELLDAPAGVLVLFQRATVEVELGAVKKLRFLFFIIYPVGLFFCANVLLRLIPLFQRELHIGLDVGQLGFGLVIVLLSEVQRRAIISSCRVRSALANDLAHIPGQALSALRAEVLGVAQLKHIIGLGAIQAFEGDCAVRAGGLSRAHLRKHAIRFFEDGDSRAFQRIIDAVLAIRLPLLKVGLGDHNLGHGRVGEGAGSGVIGRGCGRRRLRLRRFDVVRGRGGLGYGIGNRGRVVIQRQAGNRHLAIRARGGGGHRVGVACALFKAAGQQGEQLLAPARRIHAHREGRARERRLRLGIGLIDDQRAGVGGVGNGRLGGFVVLQLIGAIVNIRATHIYAFARLLMKNARRNDASGPGGFLEEILARRVHGEGSRAARGNGGAAQAFARGRGAIRVGRVKFKGKVAADRAADVLGELQHRLFVVFEGDGLALERAQRDLAGKRALRRSRALVRVAHRAGGQVGIRHAIFGDGVGAVGDAGEHDLAALIGGQGFFLCLPGDSTIADHGVLAIRVLHGEGRARDGSAALVGLFDGEAGFVLSVDHGRGSLVRRLRKAQVDGAPG